MRRISQQDLRRRMESGEETAITTRCASMPGGTGSSAREYGAGLTARPRVWTVGWTGTWRPCLRKRYSLNEFPILLKWWRMGTVLVQLTSPNSTPETHLTGRTTPSRGGAVLPGFDGSHHLAGPPLARIRWLFVHRLHLCETAGRRPRRGRPQPEAHRSSREAPCR
jgi:hypothetical protein